MIDIVTSVLMLASVFYGDAPQSASTEVEKPQPPAKERSAEEIVKEYFADTPILIEVARCESTFRHLGKGGEVIRGLHNEYDVGVMQINELYHADKAKALGFDLHTIEGNMAYAKWLYERESLAPWKASSKCWGTNPNKELTRA